MLEEEKSKPVKHTRRNTSRTQSGSATFGKRAGEYNTRNTQTLVKDISGRSFIRREHQGNGIAKETEWAAERSTKNWLRQDPEQQLRWLRTIEEQKRKNRGLIPTWFYEDLSDAYYHISGEHSQVVSSTVANRILDELIEETLQRVAELDTLRKREELANQEARARREVSRCKAEWQEAKRIAAELVEKRQLSGEDLILLFRAYQGMYGHDSQQELLLSFRNSQSKIDFLIPIATEVAIYLQEVFEDKDAAARTAYPGLGSV